MSAPDPTPPDPSGRWVVALVAARNERGSVGLTVRGLASIPEVAEVVVVDDGSTDGTAGEASAAGARVLRSPVNRGKGGALEAALERLEPADVYLFVDADVGETASAAFPLLTAVLEGGLDAAIGVLPRQEGGGFGRVKALSRWCIWRVGGVQVQEPMSGQRALTRAAVDAARPLAPRFAVETAMTIDVARAGLRVGEIPVDMRHRPTGRTIRGFAHRAGQGMDLVVAAVARALRVR